MLTRIVCSVLGALCVLLDLFLSSFFVLPKSPLTQCLHHLFHVSKMSPYFIFSSYLILLNLFNCRLKHDIQQYKGEAVSTRTSKQTIHTTVLAISRIKLWKLIEWHSHTHAHTRTHGVKSNGMFVQWNKTTTKKLHLDNLKSQAKLKKGLCVCALTRSRRNSAIDLIGKKHPFR